MADREVTITIKGKNLTQSEFDAARKNLLGVEEQTKKTTVATGSMGTAFKAMGGALAAMGVVSAIRNFTDLTGELTDMSLKTGIGVEALQRMKFAAEQNGGSLEQVTGAIAKLGANLAGGNDSAAAALKTLGLSFDEIRNMAPDQAFTAIADAIAKVPDPMAQSKLAMDLFGKSGASLLPMMKGNLTETAAAADKLGIVLSEDVVAAGDEFGDSLGALSSVGQAVIAQVLAPMIPVLTTVTQWMGEKLPGAVRFVVDAIQTGYVRAFIEAKVKLSEFLLGVAEGVNSIPLLGEKIGFSATTIQNLRNSVQQAKDTLTIFDQKTVATTTSQEKASVTMKALNLDYEAHKKSADKSAQEQAKFAAEVEKTNASILRGMATQADFTAAIERHTARVGDAIIAEALRRTEYEKSVAAQRVLFANLELDAKRSREEQELQLVAQRVLFANLETQAKQSTSSIGAAFRDIGKTIIGALQGGGSVLQSVGSSLGSALGTDLVKHFGSSITGLLGNTLGGAINAMIPGLGAMLGPLLGKLTSLFGISKEIKEARAAVVELEDSIIGSLTAQQRAETGGLRWKQVVVGVRDAFIALGGTEQQALDLVQQLWDTDRPERSRAALERVNEVMELHRQLVSDAAASNEVDFNKMREAAERYGVDLAGLGDKYQSARLHDAFTETWNDFQLLIRGGADTGAVLVGMKNEIINLALEAVRFGTQIPENFKPLIANLLESNQLTEEERVALQQLGDEHFGDPVASQFDRIADAMQSAADRLGEILAGISGIPTNRTVTIRTNYVDDGPPPGFGDIDRDGGEGFSRGTFGRLGVDFPNWGRQGTRVTVHNREAIVPYEDRVSTAKRWLQQASGAAAVAASVVVPPPQVYIVNDFSGHRYVTEAEFNQIQGRLDSRQLLVPKDAVVSRRG
jgi:hypothetical protein